jgi:ribosomal protein S18
MNSYDVEILSKFLLERKYILTDQNTGAVVTCANWSVSIGAISCPFLLDILSSLMAQSYTLKKAEFPYSADSICYKNIAILRNSIILMSFQNMGKLSYGRINHS